MNKDKKSKKILMLAITIIILLVFITIIFVQKNKINTQYEVDNIAKQEELVQKIKRKVTVLKVEEETIYGTIKFESTIENLEYVTTPEENTIKLEKETRQLAVDYELQNKQEYKFKVKVKGNEEEIIIIQIDKEDIPEVEIKQDQYATITTERVKLDRTISIKETEGYKTIYSLDNGGNWEEYTGVEVTTNQIPNAVIAQKISIDEESEDAITIEKYTKMPNLAEDAIGVPAYDYNEETVEITNGNKYIKVEGGMEGFKIQVTGTYNVTFMQEDKKTSVNGTNSRDGDKIIIPEKARYIGINGNIREIKVIPSVQFKVTYIGQTKVNVEAKSNGYSGDVTYEYYLDTKLKATSKENTYEYKDLANFYEYDIIVKATDGKDTDIAKKQRIKTRAVNSSIVGFITSDMVDKSTQSKLQPTKIGDVQYEYDITYLDKNNLPPEVEYNPSTNMYTITQNMQIGKGSERFSRMAVLKCDGNLTINTGVTVTTATYQESIKGYPFGSKNGEYTITADVTKLKGLFISCSGTLTNNGTISQTARGTYNTKGEMVYLWYNGNESYEYVPATGGTGGPGHSNYRANRNGSNGANGAQRATGGGGGGATFWSKGSSTVSNRFPK